MIKTMDSFDKIETMLAEIIEQGNEQKKTSAKLSEKMDGIDGNGGVGGFTPEEAEQMRGALIDLSYRIRAAADKI